MMIILFCILFPICLLLSYEYRILMPASIVIGGTIMHQTGNVPNVFYGMVSVGGMAIALLGFGFLAAIFTPIGRKVTIARWTFKAIAHTIKKELK